MNPSFIQSIRKSNNIFWIYSTSNRQKSWQHLQRKALNVEKRCNNEDFSRKTIKISSMYILAPFTVQNFKKILRKDPELRRCAFLVNSIFGHNLRTRFFLDMRFFAEC